MSQQHEPSIQTLEDILGNSNIPRNSGPSRFQHHSKPSEASDNLDVIIASLQAIERGHNEKGIIQTISGDSTLPADRISAVFVGCMSYALTFPISSKSSASVTGIEEGDNNNNSDAQAGYVKQTETSLLTIWKLSSKFLTNVINTASRQSLREILLKLQWFSRDVLSQYREHVTNSRRFFTSINFSQPRKYNKLANRRSTIISILKMFSILAGKVKPLPMDTVNIVVDLIHPLSFLNALRESQIYPEPASLNLASPSMTKKLPLTDQTSQQFQSISSIPTWRSTHRRTPSDKSSSSIGYGTVVSESDSTTVDNEGSRHTSMENRLRLESVSCVKSITQNDPKALQNHWFTILPTKHIQMSFLTLIEEDRGSELSLIVIDTIKSLLTGAVEFLAIADDKPSEKAFTTLSTRLGYSIVSMHTRISIILKRSIRRGDKKQQSQSSEFLVSLLSLIYTLVRITPYEKFQRHDLLSGFIDNFIACLSDNDVNVQEQSCKVLRLTIQQNENLERFSSSNRENIMNIIEFKINEASKQVEKTELVFGNDSESENISNLHAFMGLAAASVSWMNGDQVRRLLNLISNKAYIITSIDALECLVALADLAANQRKKLVKEGKDIHEQDSDTCTYAALNLLLGCEFLNKILIYSATSEFSVQLSGNGDEGLLKPSEFTFQVLSRIDESFWNAMKTFSSNKKQDKLWPISLCIQLNKLYNDEHTCSSACRTIGVLVNHSLFVEEPQGFEMVFEFLSSVLNGPVKSSSNSIQASWALANLFCTLVQLEQHCKANLISDGLYMNALLLLKYLLSEHTSVQVRVSVIRATGAFLSVFERHCQGIANDDYKQFLKSAGELTLEIRRILVNGSAKERWNAGTALSGVFRYSMSLLSDEIQCSENILKEVQDELLEKLKMDKYFKVRSTVANALYQFPWEETMKNQGEQEKILKELEDYRIGLDEEKQKLSWKEIPRVDKLKEEIKELEDRISSFL